MNSFVVFTVLLFGMIVGGESLKCYNCIGEECQSLGEQNLKTCENWYEGLSLTMACYSLNSQKEQRGCSSEKICDVIKGECKVCFEDKCNGCEKITVAVAIATLTLFVILRMFFVN
ncbi:hypothetical protein ACFFRR_000403 [Megaselia abdita]